MATFAALLATQIVPWWAPVPDGSCYLSIARSIAHGGPVTNLGSPKLHYAPGYPLLISPAFFAGERPFLLLAAMQWLFAIAFMAGVYQWARRWFPGAALWIVALVMANASLWMYARLTLSEMAFMAVLMWAVNGMDRLTAAVTTRGVIAWTALAAALVAAATAIRPAGVLFAAGYTAVAFLQAWRKRVAWTRAVATSLAVGLPAALALVALLVYETRMAAAVARQQAAEPQASSTTYLDEFRLADWTLAGQALEGVRLRVSETGRLLVPGMFGSYARSGQWLNVNMLVYVPLFCAIAWAWWRLARAGGNVFVLAAPFYLALYIAYPVDQRTRYLLPLLPLLAACVWWLCSHLSRPHQLRLLGALVAAHLAVAVGTSVHDTRAIAQAGAVLPDIDALAVVVRHQPEPVAVWQAPRGVYEMAQVATDRGLVAVRGDEPIPHDAAWVITRADTAAQPGFVERTRAGSLKLLERTDRLSRTRAASEVAR
ncbi:MAG: hypothetical protein HYX69_00200 [Planctomycetia bacterium]|nr:hypothetical protein [Planctomycetia bacterium]